MITWIVSSNALVLTYLSSLTQDKLEFEFVFKDRGRKKENQKREKKTENKREDKMSLESESEMPQKCKKQLESGVMILL